MDDYSVARFAPRSIVNSTSISPREWFMSDCDIRSVRSLPLSEASTSDSRSESAGAIPSNGSSSKQTFGADRKRAAKCDQLLLAAAQQQRLAMAHLGEFADHLVDEFEPRLAVQMLGDPQRQQDVFLHRELRHQTAILRHVADPECGACVARTSGQIGAFEPDRSLRRLEMAHDGAHQRGFAGAVAADQADHGAPRHAH